MEKNKFLFPLSPRRECSGKRSQITKERLDKRLWIWESHTERTTELVSTKEKESVTQTTWSKEQKL
eukprot:10113150-Heterocapsa_arctica.AAC.1